MTTAAPDHRPRTERALSALFLSLMVGLLLLVPVRPIEADPSPANEPSPEDIINRLRSTKPDTDPFEMKLDVGSAERASANNRISRAVATRVRPDHIQFTWLDVGYDGKTDKLLIRNGDWVLTPTNVGVHRWWMKGDDAAFAHAERRTAERFLKTRSLQSTSRAFQQLLATYLALRWTPSLMDLETATVDRTRRGVDRLVLRRKNPSAHRIRTLEVAVHSDGQIAFVRLIERRPKLYFHTSKRQYTLKLSGSASFHEHLPSNASLHRNGERVQTASMSFHPIPEEPTDDDPPGWFSSLPSPGASEQDESCTPHILVPDRRSTVFGRDRFRKRIQIHRAQVRRILSCADRESENASPLLREMADALRYTRDSSYMPSGTSEGDTSVFRTMLRLRRSVAQGTLEKRSSTSTSVPAIYAIIIHLLAFRSRLSSVEKPERMYSMLNRITTRYDLSGSRLFVREIERRIRGANGSSGLVQDQGKEFLIAVRKAMKQRPVHRLLMARVFRFLGYFERADKHYAALVNTEVLHPEIHAFMDAARTDAAVCLRLFDREQLTVRELLYRAGAEAGRKKVQQTRTTLEQILKRIRTDPRLTIMKEDYRPTRQAFELLLSSGHRNIVRRMMIEIIRREAGLVLSESYFFPLVNRAFGESPDSMYRLVRHLTVPVNVSPFMKLNTALNEARTRLENDRASRLDVEWIARTVSLLLKRDRDVPEWIRNTLLNRAENNSQHLLLLERCGDLMLADGNRRKARRFYRKALEQTNKRLQTEPDSDERPRPVGPYVSIPNRLSADSPLEPHPEQPLVVKYTLTGRSTDKKKTAALLNDLVPAFGSRSSWVRRSRDPGVKADYELQFLGWGLYLLDRKKRARDVLNTGLKRERSRFPYGNIDRSATFGYLRILEKNGRDEVASKRLAQVARRERNDTRPFQYSTSAGRRYVNRMRERGQLDPALSYLRAAAAREWRQADPFTYRGSASESLVQLLNEQGKTEAALNVLKKAFFRSMADLSGFEKGSAPRVLVRELESQGRLAEAIMVCRRLSSRYDTDPASLKKKINSLQKRLSTEELMTIAGTDGKSTDPDEETKQKIDELLASLKQESSTDRFVVVRKLEQMDLNVAPYLKQKLERASEPISGPLRSVLQHMAWRKLRQQYRYPDFLE